MAAKKYIAVGRASWMFGIRRGPFTIYGLFWDSRLFLGLAFSSERWQDTPGGEDDKCSM